MDNAQQLILRLQTDLRQAMKAKDQVTVSMLKSLLARFSNAEAVSVSSVVSTSTPSCGVGSTEVPRNTLNATALTRLIQAEIDELNQAIEALKDSPYRLELEQKRAILERYQS